MVFSCSLLQINKSSVWNQQNKKAKEKGLNKDMYTLTKRSVIRSDEDKKIIKPRN